MKEVWKQVVGWPDYSVSNLGRVRRDVKWGRSSVGIRKGTKIKNWYTEVRLSGPGRERHRARVHVLVLEAFTGPRPFGMVSRHLDDIKSNNQLGNLKWGRPKDNFKDMQRNGTYQGFAGFTSAERSLASIKGAETMRKLGKRIGLAALSRTARCAFAEKGRKAKRIKYARNR